MKETKCDLCGSTYYRIIYHIGNSGGGGAPVGYRITDNKKGILPLRIVRCLKCGLVYVNPSDELNSIYGQYIQMQDEEYLSQEEGRRAAARIVLKKISRFKNKGRILDVGCAAGFFLDEAKKQGWETCGVELSQWAGKFAEDKFGIKVFRGLLTDAKFPNAYFDAVVMLDSLEHLPDPKETLEEARRVLKPSGVLCLSTPDIESFLSKILRAKWWGIKQAHLYYFSRNTLNKLLDVCGFRVMKYSSHSRVFTFGYWMKCLKGYNKALYNLARSLGLGLVPEKTILGFNFRDQIEVFARKKRCLAFLNENENEESLNERKMKTVVVLPAYNAEKTLALTVKDIPRDIVDEIILVDDASTDNTLEVARGLGLKVFGHAKNKGYGANQKLCYEKALESGAEIIVMVHPDYQYDPKIIPALIDPIRKGRADAVFGSRMMKGGALEGGMPLWKHNTNILLTALENVVLGTYLTEFHSGFRAYSANYLKAINFKLNSDNFIFDTEIIVQGLLHYFKIEEVPIKTRYFDEASVIKLFPSMLYGLGIFKTLFKFILHQRGVLRFKQFE